MLLNPDHFAFPSPLGTRGDGCSEGLTVRECFAVLMMQAICASQPYPLNAEIHAPLHQRMADEAVQAADALIRRLNQK